MILTAICLVDRLRWVVPAVCMAAPAPFISIATNSVHLLRPILPARLIELCDQCIWAVFQRAILFFFTKFNGVEIEFSGDYEAFVDCRDNCVVLCNHQSAVDWIIMDMLANKQNSLGKMRFVLKDELKYIPLFGLYFWQHNCVNVGRYGTFVEEKMVKQLQYMNTNNLPLFMVIFPEATRYDVKNQKTLNKSGEYAHKNGLTVLNYTLSPRSRGTYLMLKHLDSHVKYVYDVTIGYGSSIVSEGGIAGFRRRNSPGMIGFINDNDVRLHIHIDEIPASTVPKSEADHATWLHQRFVAKDRLLKRFYASGHFVEQRDVVWTGAPATWAQTLPPALILSTATFACLGIPQGRKIYTVLTIGGTLAGILFMAFH